jgi:hypothetical protein
MISPFSLGSSFLPPQLYTGLLPQASGQVATRQSAQSSLAPPPDTVSLSKTGIDLSKQSDAMQQRASQLGSATVDLAKNFLADFAKSVLGSSADGMTISYDSAAVSAHSEISGAVQHSAGPNGSTDAAALRQEDDSNFVGKGVITTADGHRYSFEVQVQYQDVFESSASSSTGSGNAPGVAMQGSNSTAHPSTNVPVRATSPVAPAQSGSGFAVDFPGSLADLFRLFEQGSLNFSPQSPPTDNGDVGSSNGSLTMRLLDVIGGPNSTADKLAKAYGVSPDAAENGSNGNPNS